MPHDRRRKWRVKANRELFDRWNDMAKRVEHLKGIVQNDCDISLDDFNAWVRISRHVLEELTTLRRDTYLYAIRPAARKEFVG